MMTLGFLLQMSDKTDKQPLQNIKKKKKKGMKECDMLRLKREILSG